MAARIAVLVGGGEVLGRGVVYGLLSVRGGVVVRRAVARGVAGWVGCMSRVGGGWGMVVGEGVGPLAGAVCSLGGVVVGGHGMMVCVGGWNRPWGICGVWIYREGGDWRGFAIGRRESSEGPLRNSDRDCRRSFGSGGVCRLPLTTRACLRPPSPASVPALLRPRQPLFSANLLQGPRLHAAICLLRLPFLRL